MGRLLKRIVIGAGFTAVLLALIAAAVLSWMAGRSLSLQQADPHAAAPSGGLFVDAFDTRVFVQQAGDRHAPAVVFMHGTGAWSGAWRASMDHVAALGYHAIAIDLPPFGFSMPPASGDYGKATQGRRILAALDSLGVERAVFVAHSFGAAPVMEALLRAPQRAEGLVLVDAALGLDNPHTDGQPTPLQSALARPWVAEPLSAALLTNPALTETLLHAFTTETDTVSAEWIRLYQQPLAVAGTSRKVARWLPQLVAGRADAASDRIESYQSLPCPVTLIWGKADTITPLVQAQHLIGWMRRARLITIPRAGHIPQIEEPVQFRAALSQVFEKQTPIKQRP
jgi:pimeloyl-ACP methyl ester carboxylesterase